MYVVFVVFFFCQVCGHKWADLSEYDFGVSVLNDNKYGWSCINNVLRLSLLVADNGITFSTRTHVHCSEDYITCVSEDTSSFCQAARAESPG